MSNTSGEARVQEYKTIDWGNHGQNEEAVEALCILSLLFCSILGCCSECWRVKILAFSCRHVCLPFCSLSPFLLKDFYSEQEFCVWERQYYCLVFQDERLMDRKYPPLGLLVVLCKLWVVVFFYALKRRQLLWLGQKILFPSVAGKQINKQTNKQDKTTISWGRRYENMWTCSNILAPDLWAINKSIKPSESWAS